MMATFTDWVNFWTTHGFKVDTEGCGANSGIAYNTLICVPFTVRDDGLISAVSYSAANMLDIKKYYDNSEPIGYQVFSDFMNNRGFTHFGRICNHDHSMSEIEHGIGNVLVKAV